MHTYTYTCMYVDKKKTTRKLEEEIDRLIE